MGYTDSTKFKRSPINIEINGEKLRARIGVKSNDQVLMYILSFEDKYINSFPKFKKLVDLYLISVNSIISFKDSIIATQNRIIEELFHNLTSLNTYSIQEFFALIPQQLLTEKIHEQEKTIKKIISEKPNVTARTFLQLIKYNLAMKVEFSVFEKTMEEYPNIQKNDYLIRKIILSVLQIFISDFDKMKINVFVANSEKILSVDYDSLFVSLYYIFDNAVKYCLRNTELRIFFKEESKCFSISFNMISVRIEDDDIKKLCIKGYRSDNALNINEKGQGIGMYRILKTLKLNNATLETCPRVSNKSTKIKETIYENNEFKIKFKDQQDWFATK